MSQESPVLYLENDHLLTLVGLWDGKARRHLNNATITARLTTEADVDVAGQVWPVTLAYVPRSNGHYEATLQDTLVLTEGTKYRAKIIAVAADGTKAKWDLEVTATKRT